MCVIRGVVHVVRPPAMCMIVFPLLAVVAFAATGNWTHAVGVGAAIVAIMSASPTMNSCNGCLLWIMLIAAGHLAWSRPDLGLPLIAWPLFAWLAACAECRLRMTPDPAYAGQLHGRGESELTVSGPSLIGLALLLCYLGALAIRHFSASG